MRPHVAYKSESLISTLKLLLPLTYLYYLFIDLYLKMLEYICDTKTW